ncbi:MAG: EcsC family protein [Aestuariivita sp.]|nr:EcsC family protein [Aestuariivita sp.]MCY4202283.1 EcsC family protein [Aestuariivita sp.]MCY4289893.1 EcsC family protein [Aestuariivita sp.]MCY4346729.1 EcsC family protein [Aestuariivita sp.]
MIKEIVNIEAEMADIARQYKSAMGPGIQLLNLIGGQAEDLIDRLPISVRKQLNEVTEKALIVALNTATKSRRAVPDQSQWLNSAVATALGAAGGFGGLPSALLELPVTTTILLRAIQGVAVEHGFDIELESVRFDCLRIMGAAGPFASDDGAEFGFLSARFTLSGNAIQRVISLVAPRLATALGQKLAAQAIPVLGAVAGAATNYTYTNYYQRMAEVHFRLRRLAIEANKTEDEILQNFKETFERRQ